MDGDRPWAVLIQHGETAEGALHEEQKNEQATGQRDPGRIVTVPEGEHGEH